jgi:hypothetical protein
MYLFAGILLNLTFVIFSISPCETVLIFLLVKKMKSMDMILDWWLYPPPPSNPRNKRVLYSNSTSIFQYELVGLCNFQNERVLYSNSTSFFQFELVGSRNFKNERVLYSNSTSIFQFELLGLHNLQHNKVLY